MNIIPCSSFVDVVDPAADPCIRRSFLSSSSVDVFDSTADPLQTKIIPLSSPVDMVYPTADPLLTTILSWSSPVDVVDPAAEPLTTTFRIAFGHGVRPELQSTRTELPVFKHIQTQSTLDWNKP